MNVSMYIKVTNYYRLCPCPFVSISIHHGYHGYPLCKIGILQRVVVWKVEKHMTAWIEVDLFIYLRLLSNLRWKLLQIFKVMMEFFSWEYWNSSVTRYFFCCFPTTILYIVFRLHFTHELWYTIGKSQIFVQACTSYMDSTDFKCFYCLNEFSAFLDLCQLTHMFVWSSPIK